MSLHWLDNADSWICPVCGFETGSPAKYGGCKCPKCGFQDDKDKSESEDREVLEQEPCEDTISRIEVIKSIDEREDVNGKVDAESVRTDIVLMPSVTPQPKTGHWIIQWNITHQKEYYYCSECREEFSYDGETGIKMNNYDFCPNCGAKMVEPQESEE